MVQGRRDTQRPVTRSDTMRPRSPAEALEPGRAPQRPRNVKPQRKESRAVSGFVRFVSGVFTVLLVVMFAAGAGTLYVRHVYDRPGPLTVSQTVVIPRGSGSSDIAERLEREGVISSRWAFMINYLMQTKFAPKGQGLVLKHGEYLFKQNASIREVMETMSDGKSVLYRVTIPEGLTSQQIVERLKAEENLSGEVSQIPAEGSLLPETYSIEKGMQRQELLMRMQAKQKQVLDAAWERRQPESPLKAPQEAVILASIIEKETGRADERERISGVFTNRLLKNMPLQSDPTILYGIYGGGVQWGKPILQTEKDAKNAHNTYQIKGLPPTPICNPGRAAIEAAVNPAKTQDLFFVADGNGGHVFTATYKEHQAAVQNWRKVEKDIRARQDDKASDQTAAKDDIPNPPSEGPVTTVPAATAGAAAAPAAPAQQPVANPVQTVPATAEASTVPLPVKKPKK